MVNPSTAAGGTLRLAALNSCGWDPARSYWAFGPSLAFRWCWSVQRLFVRQLMAFAAGPVGGVVPDLATGPGVPNPDRTVWTYTIRAGLRFEDGSPVRAADIKYGIERMWAVDVVTGGPSWYFLCLLDRCDREGPDYRGPYDDPGGGLDSIQVPNDTTIVFRLTRPYADFDYLMAMPATAPVPREHDTRELYSEHPVASGPFKFDSFDWHSGLTLVRNPQWDPSTDPIRRPLVDRVELRFYRNLRQTDRLLEGGRVDLVLQQGVSDEFRGRILTDERLKRNADNPFTGTVRYLVLSPSTEPLDNVHCRLAVFYAVDKVALQAARGGPAAGQPTGSMTPLGLPGADPAFDPYPVGPGWTGDLTRARSELAACGHPSGFTVSVGAPGSVETELTFLPLQVALARIGVRIAVDPTCETYDCGKPCLSLSYPESKEGISACGWEADIPTTASFWTEIVQSGSAYPTPIDRTVEVASRDAALVAAVNRSVTVPADQRAQVGRQVDQLAMARAVFLPYQLEKVPYYRNPRLTNVTLDQYGQYDLVNLGVGGEGRVEGAGMP